MEAQLHRVYLTSWCRRSPGDGMSKVEGQKWEDEGCRMREYVARQEYILGRMKERKIGM